MLQRKAHALPVKTRRDVLERFEMFFPADRRDAEIGGFRLQPLKANRLLDKLIEAFHLL